MDHIMSTLNSVLILVVWIILLYSPLHQGLHMFQQNRYEIRRYLPWWKKDLEYRLHHVGWQRYAFILFSLLGILNLFENQWIISLAIGLTLGYSIILVYQSRSKPSIKPLVWTARVKRQALVMILLVSLLMIAVYQLGWVGRILLTPWLGECVALLIVVMAWITLPFEQVIKQRYIQMAKAILKKHPTLTKVGITGSYGKTSSKNILNEVLSEKYYVLSTPASYNTPMGLTITIREQLKSVHQVFIAEMGADKVGEIQFLSRFIEPSIGMVTSIGPQHLNTFKSLDNIIREKMSLIENLPSNGVGIVNQDNEYIRTYSIKNNCKIVRYGVDYPADLQALDIEYSPQGSSFNVLVEDNRIPFTTRLLGKHNIANILGAIAVGRELGLSWEQLQHAVKQVNYVEHRLQLKKINGLNYIDNAFNSNPEGSKMSLEVLQRMPGHRFIITPGMIDLGSKQDAYNFAFGQYMKGCADTVILVGQTQTKAIYKGLEESGFEMKNVHVMDTVKQAFKYVEMHAHSSDIILLENDLPDAFNR